jgi:hypothetical protein
LEREKLDTEIPPHSTKVEVGEEESSEIGEDLDNLSRKRRDDPEWVPGSLHLQRKLQNVNETEGATCSRLVGKSGRETGSDKVEEGVNEPSTNKHTQDTTMSGNTNIIQQ